MLTTGYEFAARGELPMYNELAAALKRAGHEVDVVSMDWVGEANAAPHLEEGPSGEEVLVVPPVVPRGVPLLAQRAVKWALTPFAARRAFQKLFGSRRYNVVLASMPAVLHRPLLGRVLRNDVVGILFVQDFFPIHHAEIGLVPHRLVGPLKRVEERTAAKFDIIYCNLPTNIDYLRHHYRLSREDQLISWTPLWTRTRSIEAASRAELRERYSLPQGRRIAVFGGQISEGRGIDDLLAVADLARGNGSDLFFLFVGGGRLAGRVEAQAGRAGSNVGWLPSLHRDDYLRLLTACDVGMVATVAGVSSHSFPTKLIEYLRVGIPSVVAVEPGSAFADLVVDNGVGVSVAFGDIEAFLAGVERAATDAAFRARVPAAARRMLDEVLDVRHLTAKIERDVAAVRATTPLLGMERL